MMTRTLAIAGALIATLSAAEENPSRCVVLDSADLLNLCLSLEHEDPSYCQKIHDLDMRRWCRTQLGNTDFEEEEPDLEAVPSRPRRSARPGRK